LTELVEPEHDQIVAPEADTRELQVRLFAEETGLFMEQLGLPRMAGRILGYLLLSDPPEQTAAQLTEALTASAGSISGNTRLLIQAGFIERVSLPGHRRDYFRVAPHALTAIFRNRLLIATRVRELADRGLSLLAEAPPERTARLREMRDLYAFVERVGPQLLERWESEREAGP
jgi:DNA-binding transcriptional regulator GbsR (MarR family)